MKIKKLVFIVFCVVFSTSCSAYEFKKATELTLFKNYALSSCVATYYENDEIYRDALDALNGNREYGNISLEAYHEINGLLKKWSKKIYKSKSGNISEFFMCIDFHNSKDVLAIYNKYDPCKNIDNWSSKYQYKLRCK